MTEPFDQNVRELLQRLERLTSDFDALSKDEDSTKAGRYILAPVAYDLRKTLRECKQRAFDFLWGRLREAASLQNAGDDAVAKDALREEFVSNSGLVWRPISEYFASLAPDADELALREIVKQARRALPYEMCVARQPEALVRGATVRLSLFRAWHNKDRINTYGLEGLSSLDRLADIVVFGTPPSEARYTWLLKVYPYSGDANGKRYPGGPFESCQSFKNGRFDLTFSTPERALAFARALMAKD